MTKTRTLPWDGSRREARRLVRAVEDNCDTVRECRIKGLTVPEGGCSCPSHKMLGDTATLNRLRFERSHASRLLAGEFNDATQGTAA